jgi:hypothetical protein
MTFAFTQCQCEALTRARCAVRVPLSEVTEVHATLPAGRRTVVDVWQGHLAEVESLHGITWTDPRRRDVRGGHDCRHEGMTGLSTCLVCRERLTTKES